MIRINEIFGPTFQGEGPHTGQRVGFVRFAECNLSCSWCDTPYTWDWENYSRDIESVPTAVSEVAQRMLDMDVERIVFTGGEPLIQQRYLADLYAETGLLFDVETNGTIAPTEETAEVVDLFVVSPKLAHSGDPEKLRLKPPALTAFAELARQGKAVFKWVAASESDLDAITFVNETYSIPAAATWVMPEGLSRSAHLENLMELADAVTKTKFNLSTRLHVLAWNDKRGV